MLLETESFLCRELQEAGKRVNLALDGLEQADTKLATQQDIAHRLHSKLTGIQAHSLFIQEQNRQVTAALKAALEDSSRETESLEGQLRSEAASVAREKERRGELIAKVRYLEQAKRGLWQDCSHFRRALERARSP